MRAEVNEFSDYWLGAKFRDDWRRVAPDFAAISPLNSVARIRAPLLLIHGRKDATVSHLQSVRMASRMREKRKSVEFLSLPDANHHFLGQEERTAMLAAIEKFLRQHNAP